MSVTPVSERIAQEVFTRLQSLAFGVYPGFDAPSVVRGQRFNQDDNPEHQQILLTTTDPERVTELDGPGNPPSNAWKLTFNIRVRLMPSENLETPIDTYRADAEAAVRSVICVGSAWHTFGSLAFNAMFETTEYVSGGEDYAGVVIPLSVMYRTSELDLTEVRA